MPRWTNENRSPLGNIRANAGYSRETAANIMKLTLLLKGVMSLLFCRYYLFLAIFFGFVYINFLE